MKLLARWIKEISGKPPSRVILSSGREIPIESAYLNDELELWECDAGSDLLVLKDIAGFRFPPED